jgi:hypothetical protein
LEYIHGLAGIVSITAVWIFSVAEKILFVLKTVAPPYAGNAQEIAKTATT